MILIRGELGSFDLVPALAIEKHVKDPGRLFGCSVLSSTMYYYLKAITDVLLTLLAIGCQTAGFTQYLKRVIALKG